MRPVRVAGQNADFSKPLDWDDKLDGECGSLPVRIGTDHRTRTMTSNWLPSPEELAVLNAGGVVELCCVGNQPPVSVGAVERHPDIHAPRGR